VASKTENVPKIVDGFAQPFERGGFFDALVFKGVRLLWKRVHEINDLRISSTEAATWRRLLVA
jgi:hypothetical protein